MPVCRSAFGAFTRSRPHLSTPKSLAPFLFQTPTIEQWKPTAHPGAHRNASSSSNRHYDIPFEDDGALPPSIDHPAPARQTTVTGSERAAFEKLYQKASREERIRDEMLSMDDSDRIVDEWYEEDDESTPASLDSVFDAVLAGQPTPKVHSKSKKSKNPHENLKTLAETILRPEVADGRKKSREEKAAEVARLKEIREEEKLRVQALLEQAQTDRELWDILEREVFDLIRKLDLDGTKKSVAKAGSTAKTTTDKKAKKASDPADFAIPSNPPITPTTTWTPVRNKDPRYDPRILFPNFPLHLVFATELLRKNFPLSALPLTILPTVKALGRSSYALGATTKLYNLLIRTLWTQYGSYDHIDELLWEMDNGGIEFDLTTLSLIESIIAESVIAHKGHLGVPLQKIYRMDYFNKGIGKLRRWKTVAEERLGAWAEQRARERSVVRKYTFQGAGGAPRDAKPRPIQGPKDKLHFRFSETGEA